MSKRWARLPLVLTALGGLTLLGGCSYGPEEIDAEIQNALAKPRSHRFSVAIKFERFRKPAGYLTTFPDGGRPKIISQEARVYIVDLEQEQIKLVARLPGYAGIPQPKTVWIQGWRDGSVYFRLFGYGGSQRSGDDLSDPRTVFFRADFLDEAERIEELPIGLESEPIRGPLPSGPFVRLSTGKDEVVIRTDITPGLARLIIDPGSGVPRLVFGK